MSEPSAELVAQDPPIGINEAYIFPNARNFTFKSNPMWANPLLDPRPIMDGQGQTLFYFDKAVRNDKKVLYDASNTPILNVKLSGFSQSWAIRSGRSSTSGAYLGKVSSRFWSSKILAEFTNASDGRVINLSIKRRESGHIREISLEPEGVVIARALKLSEGVFRSPHFMLTVAAGVDASLIITIIAVYQLMQSRRRNTGG